MLSPGDTVVPAGGAAMTIFCAYATAAKTEAQMAVEKNFMMIQG